MTSTTSTTVTTVGRFTFDSTTGEISGPADYMRSSDFARCKTAIENGTNVVFRAAVLEGLSPNVETALLVAVQTDYAGWAGARQFNAMREAAR